MKEFKIRCSAITEILSEPQKTKTVYSIGGKEITTAKYNKIVDQVLLTGDFTPLSMVKVEAVEVNESISQGAKTHCEKWIKRNVYGRGENVSNKYISKGLKTEEDGLNLIVKVLKLGMIYKNEERKEDEFKTGEIDFKDKGIIYDNKASYTLDTFPLFEKKLDPKYYGQMQGYLDLEGLEKGKVCYTLVDTPIDILKNEIKWIESDDDKQSKAINHVFTVDYWNEVKETLFPMAKKIDFISIPDEKRVKVFEVTKDIDYVNNINIKSKLCKKYIQELLVNL